MSRVYLSVLGYMTICFEYIDWINVIEFTHLWLYQEISTSSKKQSRASKKSGKDPNAPKRPMSAYFLWLNEHRAQIKEENPGIGITDISKKAGEMWGKVTDKGVSFCQLVQNVTGVAKRYPLKSHIISMYTYLAWFVVMTDALMGIVLDMH